MDTKKCTQCREDLPLTSFGPRSSRQKRSLQSKCKTCRAFNRLKSKFKQKYGITWDDYQIMYAAQQGRCYLCDEGGPERLPNGRPRLLLDHHHESGKVRHLLCNTGNWRIGMLETISAEWMTRAQEYISDA